MTAMSESAQTPPAKLRGLTAAEVEASRRQHGSNLLTPPPRDPWWRLFLEKFDDPVIRILMIAAFIAIAVGAADGHYIEGVGILVAILLATTLAFVNEFKAAKEFDILNKVNDDVPVKVLRDGNFTTVAKRDVVVGDAVLIEVGEEAPADGTLQEAVSLMVDESKLTGEPPKSKWAEDAQHQSTEERAYPATNVYRGTTIVDGHGVMRITAVGDKTEIGKAARAAAEETGEETPLNRQLERLSKWIGVIGFGIATLTFVALVVQAAVTGTFKLTGGQWAFTALLVVSAMIGLVKVWLPVIYDAFELTGHEKEPTAFLEADGLKPWLFPAAIGLGVFAIGLVLLASAGAVPWQRSGWLSAAAGGSLLQFFMIAVTIIVVAVPEGLAMSVTLSLAYSMRKMTAANNLVRQMHACETIGAATVICSDKTGTLTMNEMKVRELAAPGLNGSAFAKTSDALAARLIVEAVSANTTAHLSRVAGEPVKPLGNPTEGSLLLWLDEHGIDYVLHRDTFRTGTQLTFSTERKYMGTLGKSAVTGGTVLHIKGAPEIVLSHCRTVLVSGGEQSVDTLRDGIEAGLRECQARGERTLGFAYKTIDDDSGTDIETMTRDMVWLGYVAIADPVRPDVPAAIQACRDAGIAVKIVTGDNPHTAREIGRQIGLLDRDGDAAAGAELTGPEWATLDDAGSQEACEPLRVLSRARPMDKLRLVKSLQERGHVVAVTGDGTNDAPALNYANVGLSMGKTGTSVAKEASDIVLLDDSFNSIVNAVMWGRSLYENIQRFILFQLTINVAALLIAMLGPFIGVAMPLTVIQMLWINLIMDTFAALALATEPPNPAVMKRRPRGSNDFIVTAAMAKSIFGVGLVFVVLLVGLLLVFRRDGVVTPYEISLFFTTFVMLQFWNLFNARRLGTNRSALAGLGENSLCLLIIAAIFVGQVLITQFGGSVFSTAPLSLRDWIVIVAATSVVLWVGEALRAARRASPRAAAIA